MPDVDTTLPPEPTGAAGELAARHAEEHPLKLYGGWFCPFVQRTWITLEEKNVPYQYVEINPYKKEPHFLKMNPRGLVPTLAVPMDKTGKEQKALFESIVIAEYLEEAYTDESKYGPPLLPKDAYERARARLWIDHISTRIVPGFYRFIQHTPEKPYSIEQIREEFLGHIKSLVEEMDPQGPWFLGEQISLVDISLAPWAARLWLIDHYKNGGVGIPDEAADKTWSRWLKWKKAVEERPSVKNTLSDSERYLLAYKRYADDTTDSQVARATREGQRLP
ncbi:glutathione-S-transferase theta, GST [Paramyrothecium foliicola]|nr:glutathione-S-transferase theta, GST [Paramyrothecium foliicola]